MSLLKSFRSIVSSRHCIILHKFSSLKLNYVNFARPLSTEPASQKLSEKGMVQEIFNNINLTYYGQKRVNKHDVYNLFNKIVINPGILHEDPYAILLLNYCGNCMPDEHPKQRSEMLYKIWNLLEENNIALTIAHYNSLLQMLIENKANINGTQFIKNMKCEPNDETFNLLLNYSCEIGNVKQATEIIQMMKEMNFPISEFVFNSLILGHSIDGGLTNAVIIMETMRAALVAPTPSTYTALLKGLGVSGDSDDIKKAMQMIRFSQFKFTPPEVLEVATFFCTSGNYKLLPLIKSLIDDVIPLPRHLIPEVHSLCTQLVCANQHEAAIKMLEIFGDPASADNFEYGIFILKEMIETDKPKEKIVEIALNLRESDKNKRALENTALTAMQLNKVETALTIFEVMKQKELPLRPHYFWPLLLHCGKYEGEEEFMKVIMKMHELGVHADLSTFEFYIFPYCNLIDPNSIIIKFQRLNYTVTELLTPLCIVLLRNSKIIECSDLCATYKLKISGDHLIKPLAEAWKSSDIAKQTCKLLRRICETSDMKRDWTGEFLIKAMRMCKNQMNHRKFYKLVQQIEASKLVISSPSYENLKQLVNSCMSKDAQLHNSVMETIDKIFDVTIALETDTPHIPHPRSMNMEQLECHYEELKSKNMETRGILRKLIQMQGRAGNTKKAEEFYKNFVASGYETSPGMLSNLMEAYIKAGDLKRTEDLFKELVHLDNKFKLDDYKLIDYAALLVANDRFDNAVQILQFDNMHRTTLSGKERNVWRLLNAQAEKGDVEKTDQLFQLLLKLKLCNASNALLGPLVRVHLINKDLEGAVTKYAEISSDYKHTPLQLELLCSVLETKDTTLLQQVVDATSKVHGENSTRAALVTALCECRMGNSVRKMLIEKGQKLQRLMDLKYDRWVQENKLEPMQVLAKAAEGISGFKVDSLHTSIMRLYSLRNDYDGALQFLRNLEESEQIIQPELLNMLAQIFNSNKIDLPEDIIARVKENQLKASD